MRSRRMPWERDVGMSDAPANDPSIPSPNPPLDLNSPAFGGTSGTGANVPSTPIDQAHAAASDTTKTTQQSQSWQQNVQPNTAPGQPQPVTQGGGQWLRQIKLTVYASTGGGNQSSGIDLSQMRINFSVHKTIISSSPNLLKAKVYNLSRPPGPDTVGKVKQYGRVQLACGYLGEGNLGMIFDGTVILYVVGKDNPTDSYIEILAGDEDPAKNHGIAALNWPAGSTPTQRNTDMAKAGGYQIGEFQPLKGEQKAIRSVSYIGMVDKGIRNNTNATRSDFFVDDGKAYVIPWSGYRQSDVVILSPTTGLIGIPKVTPNGIEAQCLLNPKLRLGGLVKIDTSLLSDVPYEPGGQNPWVGMSAAGLQTAEGGPGFSYAAAQVAPPTGYYKIQMLNHFGDTRGNEWYSEIIGAAAGADGTVLDSINPGTAFMRQQLRTNATGSSGGAG
jgi:hypothetical protein